MQGWGWARGLPGVAAADGLGGVLCAVVDSGGDNGWRSRLQPWAVAALAVLPPQPRRRAGLAGVRLLPAEPQCAGPFNRHH